LRALCVGHSSAAAAIFTRRRRRREGGGLQGKEPVHWPLQQGAWAGRQLTRRNPTYQMFLVRELLAF